MNEEVQVMSSLTNFDKPFVYNNTAFRSFQTIKFDDSWKKLGEYKPEKLKTFLAKTDRSSVKLGYDDGFLEFIFQKNSQVSVYDGFIKYNSKNILSEYFIPK